MPESYNVEEGVSALIAMINRLKSGSTRPIIVSIAGGSASGKSSIVSARVADAFKGESILITMDDYFKGKSFVDSETAAGREINFDHPNYIDIALLERHMQALKASQPIDKPIFSFKTQERMGTEPVTPPKVVIVEGIMALHEQLAKVSDVKAFVDASTHSRVARRLARDLKRTVWTPSFIIGYMGNTLEKMYAKYVGPTMAFADMVITNNYDPYKETLNSDKRELQIKFKVGEDFKVPYSLAAQLASQSVQRDDYYTSDAADLRRTDEIIRIRTETGKKTFTYKGPRLETQADFLERANISFPIESDAERGILELYNKRVVSVTKERFVYITHDGVEVCIDRNVARTENGKTAMLGHFLNVAVGPGNAHLLDDLRKAMAPHNDPIITASYYNM